MTLLEYIEIFVKWFNSPYVSDNVNTVIWAVVLGSAFLEFSKVKVSPWTWLIRKFGKVMNAELKEDIRDVSKRLTKIEERQDRTEHQIEVNEILEARRRILRINSEIVLQGRNIDPEYLHNVMEDIAVYEDYCKKHSDVSDAWYFSNEECPNAIENIRTYYTERHKELREKAIQKKKI